MQEYSLYNNILYMGNIRGKLINHISKGNPFQDKGIIHMKRRHFQSLHGKLMNYINKCSSFQDKGIIHMKRRYLSQDCITKA